MNLSDISSRLGLSISTVSRALRNAEGVDARTRARVIAEATRGGYRGPARAGTAKGGRTRTFLALSHGDSESIPSGAMAGMSRAAIEMNVSILTHQTPGDAPESILSPKHQPPAMRAGKVDGIVLLHSWPEAIVNGLQENLPVVSLLFDARDADVAGIDCLEGMETLFAHLSLTRPGAVGYFDCHAHPRLRQAFAGLQPPDITPTVIELHGREAGEAAIGQIARSAAEGLRSWICADVASAECLAECARRAGLRLPKHLSVAVFHPSSRQSLSPLRWTTLEVPAEELGVAAVRRLLHRVEYPDECVRRVLLKAGLLIGETTPEVRGL